MKLEYIDRLQEAILTQTYSHSMNLIDIYGKDNIKVDFFRVLRRTLQRIMYHSVRVWSMSLDILCRDFSLAPTGATICCGRDIIYEIEAFICASKLLTEKNIIGDKGYIKTINDENLRDNIFRVLNDYNKFFYEISNKIRNYSVHVKRQLVDRGVNGLVHKSKDGKLFISIKDVYIASDGEDIDLFDVFKSIDFKVICVVKSITHIICNFIDVKNVCIPVEYNGTPIDVIHLCE